MSTGTRFSKAIAAALDKSKILGIRAGRAPHRFIGIWVVVVEGRVFVRSWTLKPGGWYRTFLEDPQGTIQVGDRELPVRAQRTTSERLRKAVDQAYRMKYPTPWSRGYVRGFARGRRRESTTELVPLRRSLSVRRTKR